MMGIEIPLLLAINIGTTAMLALCGATVIIRQRHFNKHGKEALLVLVLFVIATASLRWIATNEPQILSTDWQRVCNSLLAIGCAAKQWLTVLEAEVEERAKKLVAQGKDLLEVMR